MNDRIIVADYGGMGIPNSFKSVLDAKKYFAKLYGVNFDAWECKYEPYYGDSYTAIHNGVKAHFAVVF